MSDASDQRSVTFNLRLAARIRSGGDVWYHEPDGALSSLPQWRTYEQHRLTTSHIRDYPTIGPPARPCHIPIIPTEIQAQDTATRVGLCYHTECDCCGLAWDFDKVAIIAYGWTGSLLIPISGVFPHYDEYPYPRPYRRGISFRLAPRTHPDFPVPLIFGFGFSPEDGLLAGDIIPYSGTYDLDLSTDLSAASVMICQRTTGAPDTSVATDAGAYAVSWRDPGAASSNAWRPMPLRVMTADDVTWQPWVPSTSTLDLGMPAHSSIWPFLGADGLGEESAVVAGYHRRPDDSQATPGYHQCRMVHVLVAPGGIDGFYQEYQSGVPQYGPDQYALEDLGFGMSRTFTFSDDAGATAFATDTPYWPDDYELVGYYYIIGYDDPTNLMFVAYEVLGTTVPDFDTPMEYMLDQLDQWAQAWDDIYFYLCVAKIYRHITSAHTVSPTSSGEFRHYVAQTDGYTNYQGEWYYSGGGGPSLYAAEYTVDMWSPRRDMPPPYLVMGLDGEVIPGAAQ